MQSVTSEENRNKIASACLLIHTYMNYSTTRLINSGQIHLLIGIFTVYTIDSDLIGSSEIACWKGVARCWALLFPHPHLFDGESPITQQSSIPVDDLL